MPQTINNKIQRGFSGSAQQYDLFAGLHREIADKLLAKIVKEPLPKALLDVGCGTGHLTVKVKESFPSCKVVGLDFSQEMLKVAAAKHGGIQWVLADGHDLPFADGSFDMLISNLAYQWAGDLSQAFSEARRVLSANGTLACTLFGFNTCQELFQSLDQVKMGALQFDRLPDEAQISKALIISGFTDILVDREEIKIEFKDLYELMAWLKSIGANNLGREGYVGKEAMIRAAAIYREHFPYRNGIQATFEVIHIYVKK